MTNLNDNEEFSTPIDISDIINVCKEYHKLGWNIQNQIENILELGVEESIQTQVVQRESLPHIQKFLETIYQNGYFGDASNQAQECIFLIKTYQASKQEKLLLN